MHQGPEAAEEWPWNMGEPEQEEDHVVRSLGLPVEDVGDHVVDVAAPDTLSVDLEGLRRGIDDGQVISGAGQGLSPPPRSPRQFEHVASRVERVQRGDDDGDLAAPLQVLGFAMVVAASAVPPVVVLRCSCPVKRSLLLEKSILHWHSLTQTTHRSRAVTAVP